MAIVTLNPTKKTGQTHRLNTIERNLISVIQNGLPLVSRPYAEIAKQLGLNEHEVISMIEDFTNKGLIKRHGVVVRHHEAGYRANAMIVWDVPDEIIKAVAMQMKEFRFITLCYRRPRQLPEWPYNLFCMIHGHDRDTVLTNLQDMIASCNWQDIPYEVLFSKRRFKQKGATYFSIAEDIECVINE